MHSVVSSNIPVKKGITAKNVLVQLTHLREVLANSFTGNDLDDFRNVDPKIANAAITDMERHFLYLTEECVPFVLFSDQILAA